MPEDHPTKPALRPIPAEDCIALRHSVLRPNQDRDACRYPLDNAPGSYHISYFNNAGQIIGIGSIFHEPPPERGNWAENWDGWRIRGMAVDPAQQGQGIGVAILKALIAYAAAQPVPDGRSALIWCNGRTSVEPFYRGQGFERVGEVFDLPPIGPHVVLQRRISAA